MNARNHSRSLVVRCPSLRCSGISGTSPKYKPCSLYQSLYALQSDTMVSVIRRLAIFRKAWFAARLPMALACERNRLALVILSSSSPGDMTDLGTGLPPYQCATPRGVPRDRYRATNPVKSPAPICQQSKWPSAYSAMIAQAFLMTNESFWVPRHDDTSSSGTLWTADKITLVERNGS